MGLYVVERKTTSEDIAPGSPYWKRLEMDSQVSTYVSGSSRLGFQIHGCLYDVLRKPQHRPSEKKNETPDAYERRVLEAISEKPAYYYQRGVISRLDEQVRESEVDNWQTSQGILASRRLKMWPRNADSCMQWHRECDYFAVCSGVARIDDGMLFRRQAPHEELAAESQSLELLTQSSMRAYRACPRRYYYCYELGVRSLKRAQALSTGTSIHKGIEVLDSSDGDLGKALAALSDSDPFEVAKQRAMLTGYAAMYPRGSIKVVYVEKEFRVPFINPDSGGYSKTFVLAGKVDALAEVER